MKTIKHFKPEAIIFDKDGTLIDFNFMWGGWATYLADQISLLCGKQVHESLYFALGYDFQNKKVLAKGMLASNTMENLYQTTIKVVQSLGFESEIAKHIVKEAWHIPDPVLLAKPFTNLYDLFGELNSKSIKIAIATADDRTPTQLFIQAFDIEQFIETMVCADDGIPSKPNAEMVLEISKRNKCCSKKYYGHWRYNIRLKNGTRRKCRFGSWRSFRRIECTRPFTSCRFVD